jgi:hypothetical protein
MVPSEYMSQVMKFNNLDIDIGPVALSILEHFVEKPEFSAYQMYKVLEKTVFKIEYKNVHKRIQRLLNLGFISRVEKAKSKRNAVYYRLASEGFFYFLRKERQSIIKGQQIFENYGLDSSFQALLYSFIDYSTIIKMKNLEFYAEILHYMKQCCEEIYNILISIKHDNVGYDTPAYHVLDADDDYDNLIKFMKLKLNLNPILPKIQTIEEDLIVSYNGTKVSFSYSKKNMIKVSINKRSLTKKSITSKQFRIQDLGFRLNKVNNTIPIKEVWGESINQTTAQKFISYLLTSIVKYGKIYKNYDLSILARDTKFMTYLDKVYEDFRGAHDKLMALRMS